MSCPSAVLQSSPSSARRPTPITFLPPPLAFPPFTPPHTCNTSFPVSLNIVSTRLPFSTITSISSVIFNLLLLPPHTSSSSSHQVMEKKAVYSFSPIPVTSTPPKSFSSPQTHYTPEHTPTSFIPITNACRSQHILRTSTSHPLTPTYQHRNTLKFLYNPPSPPPPLSASVSLIYSQSVIKKSTNSSGAMSRFSTTLR